MPAVPDASEIHIRAAAAAPQLAQQYQTPAKIAPAAAAPQLAQQHYGRPRGHGPERARAQETEGPHGARGRRRASEIGLDEEPQKSAIVRTADGRRRAAREAAAEKTAAQAVEEAREGRRGQGLRRVLCRDDAGRSRKTQRALERRADDLLAVRLPRLPPLARGGSRGHRRAGVVELPCCFGGARTGTGRRDRRRGFFFRAVAAAEPDAASLVLLFKLSREGSN